MENTKQLKLIKYRDSQDRDYVWFFVNSDNVRISEEFKSEEQAQDWLDYIAALKRIEELMNAELNTSEGEELDKLVKLVEKHESKNGQKWPS